MAKRRDSLGITNLPRLSGRVPGVGVACTIACTIVRTVVVCTVVVCTAVVCTAVACGERPQPPSAAAGPATDRRDQATPGATTPERVDPRPTRLCPIPAGVYRPFFPGPDEAREVQVPAFRIEEHPVTNDQFLCFVRANPVWRRSRASRLFVDANYLAHWRDELEPGAALLDRPVTHVSWFAARAYARWIGRRLPRLAEWERVAAVPEASPEAATGGVQQVPPQDPGHNQRILDWYSRKPGPVPDPVRSTFRNACGVYDMHGLVWEWIEDFNTALVTGESRADTGLERRLFCGAGSIGSADPSDYAAFMRFAFRSSLKGIYTTKSLGFRCAADAPGQTGRGPSPRGGR